MKLDKFDLEPAQPSEYSKEFYQHHHNIDIEQVEGEDKQMLLDFFQYGASAVIMNKIRDIQMEQNPEEG
jgi:hypothetical protein